jgi:putative FmdB family regulatory protein
LPWIRSFIRLYYRRVPIYEYRCPDCDARFERIRRMAEADQPLPCPRCGATRAERELSCFAAGNCCNAPGGGGFT